MQINHTFTITPENVYKEQNIKLIFSVFKFQVDPSPTQPLLNYFWIILFLFTKHHVHKYGLF